MKVKINTRIAHFPGNPNIFMELSEVLRVLGNIADDPQYKNDKAGEVLTAIVENLRASL